MIMPDKSKAGTYVTLWANRKLKDATPDDADWMLCEVNRMADEEWGNATEGVPQLELAAAVTAACAMRAVVHGQDSTVQRAVAKTFQGLASGRSAGITIPSVPSRERPSMDDLWARVIYTILWEENPDKRRTLDLEATRYFDEPIRKLRFIRANTKTSANSNKGVAGMFAGARSQMRPDGRTRIKDYCS